MRIGLAGPIDLHRLAERPRGFAPRTNGLGSALILEHARLLRERGHQITFFTASASPGDWGWFRGHEVSVFVGPYRRRARWVDAFRSERRALRAAMAAHPVDVMHAHWTYEFALAAMASGRPCLVTVHDWGPQVLRYHRHAYRVVRLGMQARVLATAPHLSANSPYIADRVRRWYRREIPLIPNGLAMPEACPRKRSDAPLKVVALNNGFDARKNVSVLLEAFRIVRDRLPTAELHLGGTGFGAKGPAAAWADDRGCRDGVVFHGPIPVADVSAFLAAGDVFVHPSREESFGMVLVEAIAAGTPVIAGGNSGAVPWVLGHGAAGVLVDVSEPVVVAEAILSLASDPSGRRALAERAFLETRSRFSLDHVVDLYEAEYERILGLNG